MDKITVKDLVTRCEINRNTFYYYYTDLYAILTEIFAHELEKVIAEYNETRSWEESFLAATQFMLDNRRAIYHVYNSIRREEVERYVYGVAGSVMERYVEKQSAGLHASHSDKQLIASFYQSALTEMLLHWLSGGMREEPDQVIRRVGLLFDGNIEASLRRSASLPEARWNPDM